MYIIMFVLNDSKKLDMILDGWNKIGVRGVTILESIGAYRVRKRIPGRFAFTTATADENSKTLIAMVESEETVKNCLTETEDLIGDLIYLRKPDRRGIGLGVSGVDSVNVSEEDQDVGIDL